MRKIQICFHRIPNFNILMHAQLHHPYLLAYWWALAINLVIQAVVLYIIVAKTNWPLQMERVRKQ